MRVLQAKICSHFTGHAIISAETYTKSESNQDEKINGNSSAYQATCDDYARTNRAT